MRILALALILSPLPAAAQDISTAPAPSWKICGQPEVSTHSWNWPSVEASYAKLLKAERFKDVQYTILDDLTRSPNQVDKPVLEKFLEQSRKVLDAGGPCCTQFGIKDMRLTGTYRKRPVLFDGQIDLTDCGPANEKAEQLNELRYAAQAIEFLGRRAVVPAQDAAVRAMADAAARYDRMLFEGFPMFPWEALANSWLWKDRPIKDGPPHDLLVLAHPSLGAEMRTTLSGSNIEASFAIEPLGWVHYPKARAHKTWYGLSMLTTFRGDMGIGLGGVARLQNFTAGVIWHDDDRDGRPWNSRAHIFIGLDLYQFVGHRLRRYEDFKDRVETAAKETEAAARGALTAPR